MESGAEATVFRIKLINFEFLLEAEVLCEENGYRQAAQRLGLTPSLLKRRIAVLEKELELKIFETHMRQVKVTPDGQAFMNAARAFLREAGRIKTLEQAE
jgi:DNA-binding transcriptional LysR family regulator